MKIEVKIPQQGPSTETVYITKWLKNIGDNVDKGEILLETESDKAVLEIESPVKGEIVEIIAEADEEAEVGQVVAFILTED